MMYYVALRIAQPDNTSALSSLTTLHYKYTVIWSIQCSWEKQQNCNILTDPQATNNFPVEWISCERQNNFGCKIFSQIVMESCTLHTNYNP